MNFEETIAHYKSLDKTKVTQFDLAALEQKIWLLIPNRIGDKRSWFTKTFGDIPNNYEIRSTLFGYNEVALPLWDRINKGMSLYKAIDLIRKAKSNAAKEGRLTSVEDVQLVCSEYDEENKPKIKPDKKKPSQHSDVAPALGKQLKIDISILVGEYVKSFSNIEEYELKEFKNELTEWINDGIDSLNIKIGRKNRAAKIENLHLRIGRTSFVNALDILALRHSEFVFGKPINLNKVKKAKFARVKQLHPDSNGGSEKTRPELDNVINAYLILEQYSEQIQ